MRRRNVSRDPIYSYSTINPITSDKTTIPIITCHSTIDSTTCSNGSEVTFRLREEGSLSGDSVYVNDYLTITKPGTASFQYYGGEGHDPNSK